MLRELVRKGLMKIGNGLYPRAVKSRFDDGLVTPKGLSTLRETLKRVDIETMSRRSTRDYTAGHTEQGRPAALLAFFSASDARLATTDVP